MAQRKDSTNLTKLLWECLGAADPMLYMLEWLCDQLMEVEVSSQIGADKHEQSSDRKTSRSGYRPRRLDTRMGTIYLMVPKVRNGGYIPFFITERKRSEAALIQVIQETYVQGVSTRKIEKLARTLGIENISRSQVSEMTKGLNEQAETFRNRSLEEENYPVVWVDALYEKVRYGGHVVNMAILLVCGVREDGHREVLSIEPMLEESAATYGELFAKLKDRGLRGVRLVVSDAHRGLVTAIERAFPGASWQRCKVHFMRNILIHVPKRDKKTFAGHLKLVWQAPNKEVARKQAKALAERYGDRYPKAIEVLDNGLEDSLIFFDFPSLDSRKISSNNMIERLNKEIRRRTRVIGIFPNPESYVRLVTIYLMEYSEDWSVSRSYLSGQSISEIPQLAA
jgi:putative transposase